VQVNTELCLKLSLNELMSSGQICGVLILELNYYWHYCLALKDFLFVNMSDFDPLKHTDDDLAVQEAKPKLKKPPLYKVILLNDDFTPMDFVIEILMDFFNMSEDKATMVMLQVHTQGMGVCGIYSKEVAETKVYIVNDYSRENQHPLLCSMEEV
jgi:ATP-dependent Clp protease adaptor protein ClpS